MNIIARKNQRLNKEEQRFAAWCGERGLIAVFDELTRETGEVCLGLEWRIGSEVRSKCFQVRLNDFPEVWAHHENILRAEALATQDS